mmetsp:Transcript_20973/g.60124  ORF Transcript_20973/g.60124 Transcript_20973/m.60124 type:complete len:247 (+) Transcript_20973:555-1295(+)
MILQTLHGKVPTAMVALVPFRPHSLGLLGGRGVRILEWEWNGRGRSVILGTRRRGLLGGGSDRNSARRGREYLKFFLQEVQIVDISVIVQDRRAILRCHDRHRRGIIHLVKFPVNTDASSDLNRRLLRRLPPLGSQSVEPCISSIERRYLVEGLSNHRKGGGGFSNGAERTDILLLATVLNLRLVLSRQLLPDTSRHDLRLGRKAEGIGGRDLPLPGVVRTSRSVRVVGRSLARNHPKCLHRLRLG